MGVRTACAAAASASFPAKLGEFCPSGRRSVAVDAQLHAKRAWAIDACTAAAAHVSVCKLSSRCATLFADSCTFAVLLLCLC